VTEHLAMMTETPIGIIGGSGLYAMKAVESQEEVEIETPFGPPSDKLIRGTLNGREVVFLPRHGQGHRIPPSGLNFRANIYAMKLLGVERIIGVSAVGSLREGIEPGHIVIIDQFFDNTRGRKSTFFDEDIVAHISLADPVCSELRQYLINGSEVAGAVVHPKGTYLCMEGPQFSTRAESFVYRSWGMDVIGMTNFQEAKLSREAEICYSTLALSTDYDCWHDGHDDVTVDQIIAILNQNVELAQRILLQVIPQIPKERTCNCHKALEYAIITNREAISPEARTRLKPLLEKYL
jgi:5'-methylthioadenosine phosphorylase